MTLFSTGSPNSSSDSVWGEPCTPFLSPAGGILLAFDRRGSVWATLGLLSDHFQASSPGHLLLWLLGSGPWEGAHYHQREGPSCLSDLAFSQSSHWCQKGPCLVLPRFSWDSAEPGFRTEVLPPRAPGPASPGGGREIDDETPSSSESNSRTWGREGATLTKACVFTKFKPEKSLRAKG